VQQQVQQQVLSLLMAQQLEIPSFGSSSDESANGPPLKRARIEDEKVTFIERSIDKSDPVWRTALVREIVYHYPIKFSSQMPVSFTKKLGECLALAIVTLLGDHFKLYSSSSEDATKTNDASSTKVIDMDSPHLESAMKYVPEVHLADLNSTIFQTFTYETVHNMFEHNQNVGQSLHTYKEQIKNASSFTYWSTSGQKVRFTNVDGKPIQDEANQKIKDCLPFEFVRIMDLFE
jgi:hypothetical protein